MTQERFENLCARAGRLAAARPRTYLRRVVLWAAVGYAVILGALGVCLGLPVVFFAFALFASEHGASVSGMALHAVEFSVVPLVAAGGILASLRVRWTEPGGIPLERAHAPAFFRLLDGVAGELGAPLPSRVRLDGSLGAAVTERPGFGPIAGPERTLVVGLPLLAALSVEEARALFAHELAHLHRRHGGRLTLALLRLRAAWVGLGGLDGAPPRRGLSPLGPFARWYGPRFAALTFALARQQEFEADRLTAAVAGPRPAAVTLLRLLLADLALAEAFWPTLDRRARREPEPPTGAEFFAAQAETVRAPAGEATLRRRLGQALARETAGADTHPSPAERLAALGWPVRLAPPADGEAGSALPPTELLALLVEGPAGEGGSPAADQGLLPSAVQTAVIGELGAAWRERARPVWQERHAQAAAERARLAELEARADEALNLAEAWERVGLRCAEWRPGGDVQTGEAAAAGTHAQELVSGFLARHPDHLPARFALGRLLLEADDPAGVAHLQAVVASAPGDEEAAAMASLLTEAFLRRRGCPEEADALRWTRRRGGDIDRLDPAARQESALDPDGDRFLPHGLDEGTLERVQAFLRERGDVGAALLARKALPPGAPPFFVLACRRRYRWSELPSRDRRWGTAYAVQHGLPLPAGAERLVVVWDGFSPRRRLVARLRAVAGAHVTGPPVVATEASLPTAAGSA